MTDLTAHDKQSWLEPIWNGLQSHRETCIPEGTPEYDTEWENICTAMAWITEELGIETEADRERKHRVNPGTYEFATYTERTLYAVEAESEAAARLILEEEPEDYVTGSHRGCDAAFDLIDAPLGDTV